MSDYETIDHDVLVIGAGGAGLRASIEAAANGARVGLVCKSLLGKAHTVMAEGGCAAASTSTTGEWRSCTRKRRPIGFASSRRGARCSIAHRMDEFCSGTSAAI